MALVAQRLAAVVRPLTSPPLPDDRPSPEKADACDDLGRDPGRVELETASPERRPRERLEAVGRDEGKECGAEA